MFKAAIPLVRVRTSREGRQFYCGTLGFEIRSTYRSDPEREDPAYLVMVRDAAVIHVSSFPGDGILGGVLTIIVEDIEALQARLIASGADIGSGIMDQSWGDRELYLRDPSGNAVRFQAG